MKMQELTKKPGTPSSDNTAMRKLEDDLFGSMARGVTPMAPDTGKPVLEPPFFVVGGRGRRNDWRESIIAQMMAHHPGLTYEDADEYLSLYM